MQLGMGSWAGDRKIESKKRARPSKSADAKKGGRRAPRSPNPGGRQGAALLPRMTLSLPSYSLSLARARARAVRRAAPGIQRDLENKGPCRRRRQGPRPGPHLGPQQERAPGGGLAPDDPSPILRTEGAADGPSPTSSPRTLGPGGERASRVVRALRGPAPAAIFSSPPHAARPPSLPRLPQTWAGGAAAAPPTQRPPQYSPLAQSLVRAVPTAESRHPTHSQRRPLPRTRAHTPC